MFGDAKKLVHSGLATDLNAKAVDYGPEEGLGPVPRP